jgi:hypothetical protein
MVNHVTGTTATATPPRPEENKPPRVQTWFHARAPPAHWLVLPLDGRSWIFDTLWWGTVKSVVPMPCQRSPVPALYLAGTQVSKLALMDA